MILLLTLKHRAGSSPEVHRGRTSFQYNWLTLSSCPPTLFNALEKHYPEKGLQYKNSQESLVKRECLVQPHHFTHEETEARGGDDS